MPDSLDDAEAVAIAHALVQRLTERSLSPDDAAAWAAYVCSALRHLRDLEPPPLTHRLTLPS